MYLELRRPQVKCEAASASVHLRVEGPAELATWAGPHDRTGVPHWGLGCSAAHPDCVARPGAWRARPREARAVERGSSKTSASAPSRQAAHTAMPRSTSIHSCSGTIRSCGAWREA